MRFIINCSCADSISARCKYLYDISKCCFVRTGEILGNSYAKDAFAVLQSYPSTFETDVCIIYGHNYMIADLIAHQVCILKERNIFIITCEGSCLKQFRIKGKNVYLSPQKDKETCLKSGDPYGFSFDISDVELDLYRLRSKPIRENLIELFNRI